MSVRVELSDLAPLISERGPTCFLVTHRGERPHVAHVMVSGQGDRVICRAGRTSHANVAVQAELTLLFPGVDGDMSLLVDGTGRAGEEGTLEVLPTSAMLHVDPRQRQPGSAC